MTLSLKRLTQPVLPTTLPSLSAPRIRPHFAGGADTLFFTGVAVKNLYGGPVSAMHFTQGALPSCQTLSGLFALSRNPAGARLLQRMIQVQPDGNYTVIFPGHPHMEIPVSHAEIRRRPKLNPLKRKRPHVDGEPAIRILERAYARLNKQLYPDKYAHVPDSDILGVYKTKGFHYHPGTSLRDITGWPVRTVVANGGTVMEESGSFFEEASRHKSLLKDMRALLKQLSQDPQRYALVASSVGQPGEDYKYLDPGAKIMKWHDHPVEAIDPDRETVTVRDPHNTRIAMTLDYEDFFRYFNGLTIATVPLAPDPSFR